MPKLSKHEIEQQLSPKPKRKRREPVPFSDCGTPFTASERSQEIISDPVLDRKPDYNPNLDNIEI